MNDAYIQEYPTYLDVFANEYDDPDMRESIRLVIQSRIKKIVVLDDDPTGVQTVHGIYVLTNWDKDLVREAAFLSAEPVFFILTNTRAFDALEAERINREIARHVYEVSSEEGIDFNFVSRSDSTLRGHYPCEIDVLSDERNRATGSSYDGHLIVPAFFEAGRYTVNNIHYLQEGNKLVPVHRTEFAKDKVFGFSHGDLGKWVEEKTNGRFKAEDCLTLSIEDIRKGPDVVESLLIRARNNVPIIVNALSYSDLDVVAFALLKAEAKGKRYIYRTAASFVKSYGGFTDQELLSSHEMMSINAKHHGGVVIVGSHVDKTNQQLIILLKETDITPVELNVEAILDTSRRSVEIARIIEQVNASIESGKNTVLYSSRTVIGSGSKEGDLKIGQKVSSALVEIVQSISHVPRFIIAKGGITSSNIATKGLGIVKAKVLGQAAPGIPVWQTGEENRFPHMPYIIFPGNVGNERTLAELVARIIS